jgi:hypothetical protein
MRSMHERNYNKQSTRSRGWWSHLVPTSIGTHVLNHSYELKAVVDNYKYL